jgi:hypothetical protein
LIAGEGLMGVVIAVIAVTLTLTPRLFQIQYSKEWLCQIISFSLFAGLGVYLYRIAAASKKKQAFLHVFF